MGLTCMIGVFLVRTQWVEAVEDKVSNVAICDVSTWITVSSKSSLMDLTVLLVSTKQPQP
jgi:hypothetical protein